LIFKNALEIDIYDTNFKNHIRKMGYMTTELKFHTDGWNRDTYNAKRLLAIQWLEEGGKFVLQPYNDGVGWVTIGIGFNLAIDEIRSSVISKMGITNAELIVKLNDYLKIQHSKTLKDTQIQSDLNAIMNQYIPGGTFSFDNATQVKEVFHGIDGNGGIIKKYETRVDSWLANMPLSSERLTLLSLSFNGGLGPGLKKAIQTGNRAEAWYQIRYGTNSDSQSDSVKVGLAKRRYFESQMFGLYDDQNGSVATKDEAKKIYKMLTEHRLDILKYEGEWYGKGPDGSSGTRKDRAGRLPLDAAASDYSVLLSYAQTGAVQKLTDALKPAYTAFITYANNLHGDGAPDIDQSIISNAAAIYFQGDDDKSKNLDARVDDVRPGKNLSNNLLVGGAGADTLWGGKGADYLMGNGGVDTLDGGEGDDILIGGKDTDHLNGGAGTDKYVFNSGDGKDFITDNAERKLTHKQALLRIRHFT
jgi:GH24 family phage-related lysozyme (muramidase)